MTLNRILKSYDRYLATLKELNDKAAKLTEFDCGYFSIREDEGGKLYFHYDENVYTVEKNCQLKDFMKIKTMEEFYALDWNSI